MDSNQIVAGRSHIVLNLLTERYLQEEVQTTLYDEFFKNGYVKLPNLLNQQAFSIFKTEIDYLEQFSRSFNFVTDERETPRRMSAIGGSKILRESPTMWALYTQYDLRKLISSIVGTEVYPSLHPTEFMVMNYLLSPGSTHGWHLDDITYGLIIFFDAPPREDGGLVEFIPQWHEFCELQNASPEGNVDDLVEKARKLNLIQVRHHMPGDAYLLRADKCLHRVTGLSREGVRRAVFNLGFEVMPNRIYDDTESVMYGES
jgi:hypothetical protein